MAVIAEFHRQNPLTEKGRTIEELVGLLEAVGSDALCGCFDTSHANWQGLDMADAVRRLGSQLAVTHLSDNDGTFDQHRLPFDGTVDWHGLMRGLTEIEYKGTLNFEICGVFRHREPPTAVRDLMLEYVESVMAELRHPAAQPTYARRPCPLSELCKLAWTPTYLPE